MMVASSLGVNDDMHIGSKNMADFVFIMAPPVPRPTKCNHLRSEIVVDSICLSIAVNMF